MSMNAVEALNCYHGLVRECYIEQKENDRAGIIKNLSKRLFRGDFAHRLRLRLLEKKPNLLPFDLLFWEFSSKFSVCTVKPWKIKIQTIQYRKSRIWEMKEGKYRLCQESGLCNMLDARYSEKRFTQIYIALYGNAMLVSLSGTPI